MIDDNVPQDDAKTSSTLLTRVKGCDPDAWERFAALYTPLVRRWCVRAGLQDADAQDLTQEVFASVAGGVASFRHDRDGDTLRGWLRTITWNKIRDRARREAREPRGQGGSDAHGRLLALPDSPPDSGEDEEAEDRRALVRRAFELVLAGFKEHTRRAFWQVVVDGRSPEDVARELGVQVHVVYLAKSRVLARFRAEFEGLVDLERYLEPGADDPRLG